MKVLVDMNLSPRWLKLLTGEGFEAVHWSALGASTAPDLEIMAYAKSNDYVVLTHDLDFSAILAATQGEKPSVVQIRSEQLNPEAIGSQIVLALRRLATELAEGALVTVDAERTGIRILRLGSRHLRTGNSGSKNESGSRSRTAFPLYSEKASRQGGLFTLDTG
jgi:predicted nuclease of predicted toxin-antitoxin system